MGSGITMVIRLFISSRFLEAKRTGTSGENKLWHRIFFSEATNVDIAVSKLCRMSKNTPLQMAINH
jgi:hypothetical protein